MVPDTVPTPQFRADKTGDEDPGAYTADHSDEAMHQLRHPFDPQPVAAGHPGERAAV